MSYELAVVMPVFNEQDCIVRVVSSWRRVLRALGVRFLLIVLDDGSTDRTAERLAAFAGDPRVMVIKKPNSGHGPTILQGYHRAAGLAEWVFQCDSDDEMEAKHLPALWEKRRDYDALFGSRSGRKQGLGRRLISICSRLTVAALFGPDVEDVNTPYRLIRADVLRQIIAQIPHDTFAPNVIISGALAGSGLRIHNQPVPHHPRRTGAPSMVKWSLWRAAFRSFWQTLRCRPRVSHVEPRRGRRAA